MAVHWCAILVLTVHVYVARCTPVIDLNGPWEVLNIKRGYRIPATVPGSVYTALIESNIIGDPYYRNNDVNYKWIGREDWTYTRTFEVTADILSKASVILVAEGLDTFATIIINGQTNWTTNNMFIRYVYDIKDFLKVGSNNITIEFKSAVLMADALAQNSSYDIPPDCPNPAQHGECHRNFIRKEQCSFSWDWGPSFPGQGIWKNISIDAFNTGVIRELTATPLLVNNTWAIDIQLYLDVNNMNTTGRLKTSLQLAGITSSKSVSRTISVSTVQSKFLYRFAVPKEVPIHLWWPNGYGEQALYNLNVQFTSGDEMAQKTVRLGFRTIELVQEPVSGNSSQGLTFYYRVNNVPIFFKGTNWIPADSFQERITKTRLKSILDSAAEVHINSMRVWGGGVYESEDFYDITDELGILIWQDLMFSDALYPTTLSFLNTASREVSEQVRRLKRHPSIALWSGNNENEGIVSGKKDARLRQDYVRLYIDLIMPIVTNEDKTRPFVPSSPSNGPESKKEGWIANNTRSEYYGDVHYYNYYADLWDWKTFPITRFTSEYGSEAWCNYETIEPVFNESDLDYYSAMSNHRQHHSIGNQQMINQTKMHITLPNSNDPKQQFKNLIYVIQIHQAMAIRTETEHYRRYTNQLTDDGRGLTMGALYWQLNDIWQGPTWASIDFDVKWKMLHYYAKKFFNPNLISPYLEDNNLNIYMVIDEIPVYQYRSYAGNRQIQFRPLKTAKNLGNTKYEHRNKIKQLEKSVNASSGQVIMEIYNWKNMSPLKTWTIPFNLNLTSELIFQRNIADILSEAGCSDKKDCFFYFYLNSKINPTSTSWLPLTYFTDTQGVIPKANIQISNVVALSSTQFTVTLMTDNIAPFVWINAYRLSGRFSDNGFIMKDHLVQLTFKSREPVSIDTFKKSLSVQSLMDIYSN
ncbi:hypothetical protein SNE40_009317 [Patella caerulea]|uniref:beta-mannosidase n=1 Tax=Patella caerulea TaxID=87958 RepID=A0AAN8JXB9_PATCE